MNTSSTYRLMASAPICRSMRDHRPERRLALCAWIRIRSIRTCTEASQFGAGFERVQGRPSDPRVRSSAETGLAAMLAGARRRRSPESSGRCREFEQPARIIRSTPPMRLPNLAAGAPGVCRMREILEYCIGGIRQNVSAGSLVVQEGGRTGPLYVLIEGRLEGIKGDT